MIGARQFFIGLVWESHPSRPSRPFYWLVPRWLEWRIRQGICHYMVRSNENMPAFCGSKTDIHAMSVSVLLVAISYRAPVEVIRALLQVFPGSAGVRNGVGAYPLHLLCDYGSSVDSLRAVLETPEGAATITKRMKERTSSALRNNTLTTPLHFLNARMNYPQFRRALISMQEARNRQQATREKIRKQQQSQQPSPNTTYNGELAADVHQGTNSDVHNTLNYKNISESSNNEDALAAISRRHERMIASFQSNDYWQKAALLVMVEYTKQPLTAQGLDHEKANLVHACAGLRSCPSFLLEFAMLLHWDDLMDKRDAQGRLPLHVAALNHATALSLPATNTDTSRYRDTSQRTLRAVLRACPEAAFVQDSNGDLPFAVALKQTQESGTTRQAGSVAWSNGLQDLLDSNLEALETLNLSDRLYPHVWAKRMTSVDTLFQSIRQHPIVL
jgi:hypothetical protein